MYAFSWIKCQEDFKHCRSYCTENKCLECENVYRLNRKGKCVPDREFLSVCICVVLIVIISSSLCLACTIYYSKKNRRNLGQNTNGFNIESVNTIQVIRGRNPSDSESARSVDEKMLKDEFENQKIRSLKKKKGSKLVNYVIIN